MDFYQIKERVGKSKNIEIYPDFTVSRTKDLMVRGKFTEPEKDTEYSSVIIGFLEKNFGKN